MSVAGTATAGDAGGAAFATAPPAREGLEAAGVSWATSVGVVMARFLLPSFLMIVEDRQSAAAAQFPVGNSCRHPSRLCSKRDVGAQDHDIAGDIVGAAGFGVGQVDAVVLDVQVQPLGHDVAGADDVLVQLLGPAAERCSRILGMLVRGAEDISADGVLQAGVPGPLVGMIVDRRLGEAAVAEIEIPAAHREAAIAGLEAGLDPEQ